MRGLGIGDWGLGGWGLGLSPMPPSPNPNPQSPLFFIKYIIFYSIYIYIKLNLYYFKYYMIYIIS